jgi:glycosyltransferase involved in cell wall biosynthesis
MRLEVLVPTYNRQEMLGRTLSSLQAAAVPPALEVRVTVLDNNSKDETREVVEDWMKRFDGRLGYLFEERQGKSYALNSGIAASNADLIGFIDDDEEVDANWYQTVEEAFSERDVDFIGGPYKPRWGAEPPGWLPEDYPAVIGVIDGGDKIVAYDEKFPGILMGGNAVIKRAVFDKVGPYETEVGRIGDGLLAGEDEDMYRRLLAIGARGDYRPDLIIYHYIPPERLTKRYYRRWCFWRAVSCGLLDRKSKAQVAYLGGIPRYLYGQAARGGLRFGKDVLRRDGNPAQKFSNELAVWNLAGFFYGKHLYKPHRPADA